MKRILILLSSITLLAFSSRAGNVYPFRLSNVTATGEVDEVFFSATDISLSITNLSSGGRRAIIGIIGGGGGGSNNTILVAGNGLDFTDLGGGSNSLGIDLSVVMTNGGFKIISGTTTATVANGGSVTISTGAGITNVLDTTGGTYSLVGHTNQPTLLVKGLTNQTPAQITITDYGTMIGIAAATPSTVLSNIGGTTGNFQFNNGGALGGTNDATFTNHTLIFGGNNSVVLFQHLTNANFFGQNTPFRAIADTDVSFSFYTLGNLGPSQIAVGYTNGGFNEVVYFGKSGHGTNAFYGTDANSRAINEILGVGWNFSLDPDDGPEANKLAIGNSMTWYMQDPSDPDGFTIGNAGSLDRDGTGLHFNTGSFTMDWNGHTFLTTANGIGGGATNTWYTNGVLWATYDAFSFSNASSVIGLAFTNRGGVPTIYLVPDSTIARSGQSQTWGAPQIFNNSATLTLGAPTWFKSSVTVSDNVTIVSNATVSGNATISGSMNAGSFTGSMNGGNITGNQSVGTNTLAAFGSNTGTIGSAGQFLVVHLNSAGIPDGWSTVTGNSLATSTNSISAVQLNGSWNNGMIGLSISNMSVATVNGTTVMVGFASAPIETINGLHGTSLTFSNFLTPYGITMTNNGTGQIDLGGTVTMLSNSAGAFVNLGGNASGNTTQNWSGTSQIVIAIPNNGEPVKFIPNGGGFNGIQSELQVVPQDGGNQAYILMTRNGSKGGGMFVDFNDSNSGNVLIGQLPSGNANGDKRNINISTTTAVGGLVVVNEDGNNQAGMSYQFYENDPGFPRILFTNNKQAGNTNTPALHETYASFGNWTNSGGGTALNGGALTIIGSNETWLVASGRALGSVQGNKSNEYPTNRVSGFLAAALNTAQSNQTFMVVRDQTNGLWCIGVDTNGVLGAYRTNDLSTTVLTY